MSTHWIGTDIKARRDIEDKLIDAYTRAINNIQLPPQRRFGHFIPKLEPNIYNIINPIRVEYEVRKKIHDKRIRFKLMVALH